jgi:hypothetical protein
MAGTTASAWDAVGHRDITLAAIASLPKECAPFVHEGNFPARIADQATVPDRWRGARIAQLQHAANPDHYFDVEDLEAYELTLASMPNLRHEFIKRLLEIRVEKGWKLPPKPINPARDTDKTQEWPGFLPWAMCEQYGKLLSSFRVVRTLEALNDPKRSDQLEQAHADATVQMGILSHFAGDAAQPLHTTKHHHGWVGENPKGYTTDRGIHSYIDGGIVTHHSIGSAQIGAAMKSITPPAIEATDPWSEVLAHVQRSFEKVEAVYELKKSGELEQAKGKEFIESRMADGAVMLAAMYRAAWEQATPGSKDIEDFKRYDGVR